MSLPHVEAPRRDLDESVLVLIGELAELSLTQIVVVAGATQRIAIALDRQASASVTADALVHALGDANVLAILWRRRRDAEYCHAIVEPRKPPLRSRKQ